MTFRLTTAGESHGPALVAIVEGLPAGLTVEQAAIDADLIVNATSERDAVLVELDAGQTLVDLPYPATATAQAAAANGARVIDGLDVLVAQGAAAFELWTGIPAPVDVMRAAVRSA